MFKNYKTVVISFFVVLFAISCKKDEAKPETPETKSGGAVIICEGLFGNANSRIDYYNNETETLETNVFFKANNRVLGDVGQFAIEFNNEIFVVVNNSGKIERINKTNFKSISIIQNLQSPRIILPLSNKLYISDLYANKIHIIAYPSLTYSNSIALNGWVEEMVEIDNFVYSSNNNKPYIYVINKSTDIIVDSIATNEAPGSIALDKNNKIWALTGTTGGSVSLLKVNPQSKTVEANYAANVNGAMKLRINKAKDHLYFLSGSKVFHMGINDASPSVFVEQNNANWYGLKEEPSTGNIWICNAKSFVENGEIQVFTPNAQLLKTIETGINPNDIVFLQ